MAVTSKWYLHDGQKNGQQKEKWLAQILNSTKYFDPYAAICMSYSKNEVLCSYHKNISWQTLIKNEEHIKEGLFYFYYIIHSQRRTFMCESKYIEMTLFYCLVKQADLHHFFRNTVLEWKKYTVTDESQYGAAMWVTAELLIRERWWHEVTTMTNTFYKNQF
jgi:hypothetical protein